MLFLVMKKEFIIFTSFHIFSSLQFLTEDVSYYNLLLTIKIIIENKNVINTKLLESN